MMPGAKTVLVTGCSAGGVGAATALALARQGHRVFATARNLAKIPPELAELSVVTTIQLDVTSSDSVSAAVKIVGAATAQQGAFGLDTLVNNAGLGYTIPLLDADFEQARVVYDTNVWGSLRVIQAFSDLLIARKGRLVNVCSISSALHAPWMGVYASSKAALTVMSDTLRLELAPFGVSVSTVILGVVATAFNENKPVVNLPLKSRYATISHIISCWARGDMGPKGCTPAEAAASMLPDIMGKSKSGQVWRGDKSIFVMLLSWLAPQFIVDAVVSKDQGLHELATRRNQGVSEES